MAKKKTEAKTEAKPEAKPDNGQPEPKELSRRLPCKLTDEEIQERGVRLANLVVERNRVDEERKREQQRFKDQIGGLSAEIRDVIAQITTGEEVRSVDCEERYNLDANEAATWRLDVDELVEARTLQPFEVDRLRQPPLPGTDEQPEIGDKDKPEA